ncbi:MAG TPA: prepilin-type N-terminal cleavage/methylation domain-containing protein [Longimicrobiaceae bacterium]|nr:prepilin-type N-terminal cleavage/methylation domain-containing protein [Longimicrobiaceae bacterium]
MSRRSSRGFTLIEVVAALAVTGLVLAVALGAAAADVRASRRARAVTEASALAEDLLFRTPFLRWDSLTAFGSQGEGRFAAPLDRYRWRIETAPVPGEPELVEATVEVAWEEGAFTASTRYGPSPLTHEGATP